MLSTRHNFAGQCKIDGKDMRRRAPLTFCRLWADGSDRTGSQSTDNISFSGSRANGAWCHSPMEVERHRSVSGRRHPRRDRSRPADMFASRRNDTVCDSHRSEANRSSALAFPFTAQKTRPADLSSMRSSRPRNSRPALFECARANGSSSPQRPVDCRGSDPRCPGRRGGACSLVTSFLQRIISPVHQRVSPS